MTSWADTTGLKLASKNFHATPLDAKKAVLPQTHLIRFV